MCTEKITVARIWSICADQFLNCTAFDQLCNIWSIAQCTCNIIRVRVRLVQLTKCTACLVKHADWPNMPYIIVLQ